MPKRVFGIIIISLLVIFILVSCSGETEFQPAESVPAAEDAAAPSVTPSADQPAAADDTKADTGKTESKEDLAADPGHHVRLRLTDSGKDVFALSGFLRADYRYGPSIMSDGKGGIHAWFASPGDSRKEYDWITYKYSADGGNTWSNEKVVLSPTPGSADAMSVCDPDVFFYDGYYYIGYTGTVNKEGLCNNVFLARSESPDGPFEKWDGKQWGGSPVPSVYFEGIDIGWGVGEPSFVVLDDTLYVYNTLDSFSDVFGWVRATQVHTADLTDPMWPSKLNCEGISVFRNDSLVNGDYTYEDSDSWDVAYLEDSKKFVALATNRRFKDDSCLLYYESDDGVHFERVSELNTNVITGCHNCGLMADGKGHISKDDNTMLGYAYSGSDESRWGMWATRFAPVKIDYTKEIDRSEDGKENLKQSITIDESLLSPKPIMLLTDQLTYTGYLDNPVNIKYYLMNSYRKKTGISAEQIKITYDQGMLRLGEDNRLVPIKEGVSMVEIEYGGLRRQIRIRVLSDDYDETTIRSFYPVCKNYYINAAQPIIMKIRPMAVFEDYSVEELSGYEINANNLKFRSSDTSVVKISRDGTLTPVASGTAVITVQAESCGYTVDVYVNL
ncbi:MAG: hypothetical protein IKO16_01800 [Lachnospiraceae bacterium]|nr:hypothetical protein [Lachnospiraceae bacterium]